MRKSHQQFLAISILIVSFFSVAMTSDSRLVTKNNEVSFFGRDHVVVGNPFVAEKAGALVISPLNGTEAGVMIPLTEITDGSRTTLNVIHEPIHIAVGDSYYSELVAADGSTLASTRFEQISTNETNVYLTLSEELDLSKVRFATYHENELTAEFVVPAVGEEIRIGTVESVNQAWAGTSHTRCDFLGCTTETDPSDTSIRFAEDPDQLVPFTFLSVDYGNNDKIRNAAAMRLVGKSALVITDENNDELAHHTN